MTNLQTMSSLYPKLQDIGVPKQYIQSYVLPDWWDEELDEDPDALITAAGYISTRLNIEFRSLLTVDARPEFSLSHKFKYKKSGKNSAHQVVVSRAIASLLGGWAAYACPSPYRRIEGFSPQAIREEILKHSQTVDLHALLQFCWASGIPVLHLTKYPKSSKESLNRKFDGLVLQIEERPVIIISVDHPSPSKLSFILAHELGHICLSHIQEGEYLDQNIEVQSDVNEERQANCFATEILHGQPNPRYKILRAHDLENFMFEAKAFGEARIDPGAFLWNYVWNSKKERDIDFYPLVMKTLKVLEKEQDAPSIINECFEKSIDWDKLSEERQDYLREMVRSCND